MIYEALREIDGIGQKGAEKIRIGIAKDGSGVGAALIALVASAAEKPEDYRSIIRGLGRRKPSDVIHEGTQDSVPTYSVSSEHSLIHETESSYSTSNAALIAAGIIGAIAVGAMWWARRPSS
jgi:hexokinase